jgi:hypothetical protein
MAQSKGLFARSACNNLSGNSTGLASYRCTASPPAPAPNRTSARATTARPWQLCSARLTVAEARSVRSRFLDQHISRLKQELEVHDGFHRSPLVPRSLKALKYFFPCAVRTAQCRLSNELNRFGCAAEYKCRARADAKLWINWKVSHGEVTQDRGRSSTTGTKPFNQRDRRKQFDSIAGSGQLSGPVDRASASAGSRRTAARVHAQRQNSTGGKTRLGATVMHRVPILKGDFL